MAFFTVVIPLYNKENYVKNTIESVLNQSFEDFEIIIVEDCSTDNSKKIVRGIDSNKIKIIQHPVNKGLSASRNTGIKSASSDYIAFLDADDLWKPTYLEKIFDLIKKFPEAKLFASNYEEIYPNKQIFLPTTKLKSVENDLIVDDFYTVCLSQNIYCPSSLCVKKTVFDEIGFYNENITFGEDIDFNIRANFSNKLAYSKDALVSYIMYSENQITNSSLKNKTITDFDSYEILAIEKPNLKKYLDFNRYMMAKYYKLENNFEKFNKMKNGIHPNKKISGLNYKQLFMLNAPVLILKFIKRLKRFFMKKGIKFSTYG
jgi:glycosyltransferase involved in cell wall biosynthesis